LIEKACTSIGHLPKLTNLECGILEGLDVVLPRPDDRDTHQDTVGGSAGEMGIGGDRLPPSPPDEANKAMIIMALFVAVGDWYANRYASRRCMWLCLVELRWAESLPKIAFNREEAAEYNANMTSAMRRDIAT
jgi:hypothetical protein